jgi:hypothetical protein
VRVAKPDLMPVAASLDIAITVLEEGASIPKDLSQASVNRSLVWLRKLRSMALTSAASIKPDGSSPADSNSN